MPENDMPSVDWALEVARKVEEDTVPGERMSQTVALLVMRDHIVEAKRFVVELRDAVKIMDQQIGQVLSSERLLHVELVTERQKSARYCQWFNRMVAVSVGLAAIIGWNLVTR